MIKLSKIYSNQDEVFPEVRFKTGLNIVFASVTKGLGDRDSHSLGKTLFIKLLDYMLIKEVRPGNFPRKPQFSDFIFYLELQISASFYVTVRRSPEGKVFLHTHEDETNLFGLPDDKWEYPKLGSRVAKQKLDDIVMLSALRKKDFTYRHGLRYCFRTQNNYEDIFKVNTSREGDLNWKPYLGGLLGIDSGLLKKKFEANKNVENIEKAIKEIKDIPQVSSQSIEAEIEQIKVSLSKMEKELDEFNFRKADTKINRQLVDDISNSIAEQNAKLYVCNQRIAAIDKSLKAEFTFDLDKIDELFEEVQLHMPESLMKSYEELIELNKQMTVGRKKRLKKAKKNIEAKKEKLEVSLDELNETLSKLSKALLEVDAFAKYKSVQKVYTSEESRLAVLQERLTKMDLAGSLTGRLDTAKESKVKLARQIAPYTSSRENEQLKSCMDIFTAFVEDVLGIGAFFFVDINKEGNPEFSIKLKDQTSVADGFSYTRVLAALFDLMLLVKYHDQPFYRFAYHDGLLESLDDRVKRRLLSLWRDESEKNGLQLIISVLDSDVPYNEDGAKEYFEDQEIIKELHDRGDEGRLFRMPAF